MSSAATAWAPESSLRPVLVVAPLVYALHNLEESVAMVRWAAHDLPALLAELRGAIAPELLPPGAAGLILRVQPPTAPQFWLAAAVATAVPLLICGLAVRRGPASPWTRAAVWLQAVFCVNVFIPHLAGTFFLERYTPGVVSAVLLNLPLSVVMFRGALREHVVSPRALAIFAASTVLAAGLGAGLLAMVARLAAGTPVAS